MNKVALICGVSGQDGALLAQLLLAKGYDVWGTSRDAEGRNFSNLVRLGIRDSVRLISMNPEDFSSVFRTIKQSNPNEIYFLAGQSSVGLSFEQPAETIQSNVSSVLNILETCRILERPSGYTTQHQVRFLATLATSPRTRKRLFGHAAHTLWQRHQHSGW